MSHDVIIVGARCAGATLAAYLARSGVKTLLLDAAAMPSNMPMSTHFLQPAGMAILDEIGVGDALRACTPPAPCLRFRVEGHDAYVRHPAHAAGCCPRRSTLDPLLQQAAVGAGFALVGDAGSFKDFATGQGISSAFISARTLHKAILDGSDAAYERYWRERDVESLPLLFDALRLGEADVNDAFLQLLFEHLERSPELTARFAVVSNRTLSPLEVFSTRDLLRMVVPALLRGRFDVLPPFLRTGRRIAGFKREVARRAELLRRLDT